MGCCVSSKHDMNHSQIALNEVIPQREIIILGSKDTLGDFKNASTMDYYHGVRLPWVSLIAPKLLEIGYVIKYLDWRDYKNTDVITWEENKKYFVLVTSIWNYADYSNQFTEFLQFMKDLSERNIILIENSIDFIIWNSCKSYMTKFNLDNQMKSTFISTNHFKTKYVCVTL